MTRSLSGPMKGLAFLASAPRDHAEGQVEQHLQLGLPVSDQARRERSAPDEGGGRENISRVYSPVSSRLAGPGVVGQQEPQAGLPQHVVVTAIL